MIPPSAKEPRPNVLFVGRELSEGRLAAAWTRCLRETAALRAARRGR